MGLFDISPLQVLILVDISCLFPGFNLECNFFSPKCIWDFGTVCPSENSGTTLFYLYKSFGLLYQIQIANHYPHFCFLTQNKVACKHLIPSRPIHLISIINVSFDPSLPFQFVWVNRNHSQKNNSPYLNMNSAPERQSLILTLMCLQTPSPRLRRSPGVPEKIPTTAFATESRKNVKTPECQKSGQLRFPRTPGKKLQCQLQNSAKRCWGFARTNANF